MPDRLTVITTGAALAAATSMVAIGPVGTGLAILAVASLAAMVRYSWLRVGWFVFGALLVFQTSDTVTAQKLAYLAGAAVVAAISAGRVLRSQAEWLTTFRRVLALSLALMLLLAMSLVLALRGATFTAWLRDAAPMLLLALSPFVALDCAHDLSERALFRITLLAGFGGAIGFTSDWLARRGVGALPFGRLLLATTTLAAAGLAVAITRAALSRRHVAWAVVGATMPTMMLTTGSRTIMAFLAALPGVVGARSKARVGPWLMLSRIAVPVVALAAGVLPILGPMVVADDAFFDSRIRAALTVIQDDPLADQSYFGRHLAYVTVMEEIPKHPILGVGPGNLGLNISLDTPLTTVLKFGIGGTALILLWFAAIVFAARAVAQEHGYGPPQTQLRVFLFVMVAMLPFGSPLEDKGLPMAMCLLLAAVASMARTSAANDRQSNTADSELVGAAGR